MTKLPGLCAQPGLTIINTESGGYGLAPRGSVDIDFDRGTADPGAQLLEKMVSGAYQGSLLFELLKRAAEAGLFSSEYASYLRGLSSLSARDINDFCLYPYSGEGVLSGGLGCSAESDRQTVYWLIDGFIERAAKLSAMNLAAVIVKSGKGTNPCLPVLCRCRGDDL